MNKVLQEPGYILHSYRYRESSLILEVFSRHHGRVSLLAKGARRWKKRSAHTYLRPFQEMIFSWSGRSELMTLTGAEEVAPSSQLQKSGLYCGFYMNELLMRLLHKHDPHEDLYDGYRSSLLELEANRDMEPVLRLFEKNLLVEIGYGLNLDTDVSTGQPVEPSKTYYYLPQGPSSEVDTGLHCQQVSGRSLIAFRDGKLDDSALREIKRLMRRVIDQQLNYKPLASRSMFVSRVAER